MSKLENLFYTTIDSSLISYNFDSIVMIYSEVLPVTDDFKSNTNAAADTFDSFLFVNVILVDCESLTLDENFIFTYYFIKRLRVMKIRIF